MRTHTLENETLRIEIVPEEGGRIESFIDRRTGKDWVWHTEDYHRANRPMQIGAPYRENWRGGWEEVFPNDAPGEFQDYELVDHGELWSQPWTVIEKQINGIKLSYRCANVPVHIEKTIVFSDGNASLRLHYLLRSHGTRPLPYLFKLHPAIAIETGDEFLLPPSKVEREASNAAHSREFFCATELSEGWAGVLNRRTQTALKILFNRKDFPAVGVFQSYHDGIKPSVLLLEPSSSFPWDLRKALSQKTCAVLGPGARQEYHFEIRIT